MTSIAAHPIRLLEVFFVRNIVVAVPQHIPTDAPMTALPDNNLQIHALPEEKLKYRAAMRTILNPKSEAHSPYMIDVECVGTFEVDDTLSEAEAQRGVLITANSVLFGAIRESVAWITGRQVFGTALLGLSVLQPPPAVKDQPVSAPAPVN